MMYQVYDADNDHTIEFNSYEDLVNWLSKFNHFYSGEFFNEFLEKTGTNPGDTYSRMFPERCGTTYKVAHYDSSTNRYKIYRCNRILCDGKSIYDKCLINDVKRQKYNPIRNTSVSSNALRYHNDPIPYTGKRRYGYKIYRCPQYLEKQRNSCNTRPKLLINTRYDDYMRDFRNNGWKSQNKRRSQWMNGVICDAKHRYKRNIYVGNDPIDELSA